jgi:acyl-CoA thioester hydrolase
MTATEPSGRVFVWPLRVYWEDTDAGGVVYHSVYLNYFERCRSELLRAAGIDQRQLREEDGVQFAVVDMNVRWLRPAQYDDQLAVTVQLAGLRGASLHLHQALHRGDAAGELLASAAVRVAAIEARSLRPTRVPGKVAQAFAAWSRSAA